jgi:transcriptional regulator with GAF, ATPase, and Fis domain
MESAQRPSEQELITLLQRRVDVSPPPKGAFVITVIEGPDRGLSLRLDDAQPSRLFVGQSTACDLRLTDREVSRRHAALELAGERLRVTDLGSKNGTFIDRIRVGEAFLAGGEVLRLGQSALEVSYEVGAATAKLPTSTSFGRVIGASREMRRVYPLCEKLAKADVSIIIEGETGTGKELLAESLHDTGPRAAGPFVVFDCTAVPPNLVESVLFGHERGAFTGAVAAHRGLFEQAEGGTLLIDEIGDLAPELQPKLLRAVERGEIRRVGGERAIQVNVRIMAATRRNLDHEVQASRFRDDLFHRLAVARIELPPLRARRGDVPVLVRHFCGELKGDFSALDASVLSRWEDSEWPGNVRELKNAVARRLVLGELAANEAAPSVSSADLVARVLARELPLAQARQLVIDEFEQRYIAHVLEKHGGAVAEAAKASGIARRHFQRLKAKGSPGR